MTAVLTTTADVRRLYAAYTCSDRLALPIFLDTETTGLNPRRNRLVAVQLKQGGFPAVVLDWRDAPATRWIELLTRLFAGTTGMVVGHNLKFDLGFLFERGLTLADGRIFDTQIAEQLLLGVGQAEAKLVGGVSLKATYERYRDPKRHPDISKEERNWFIDLDQRPDEWDAPFPPEQVAYMAQDVDVLPIIYQPQRAALRERKLRKVEALEMRTLPALARIEQHGILIDATGWRAFIAGKADEAAVLEATVLRDLGAAIVAERIEEYDRETRVYEAYREDVKAAEAALQSEYDYVSKDGPPDGLPWGKWKLKEMAKWRGAHPAVAKPKLDTSHPNIGSNTQLLAALQRLGVPVKSTKREYLKEVQDAHPVVKTLLDWRVAQKFVVSFGDNLLAKGEPTEWSFESDEDGAGETHELLAIHPTLNPIGAGTGRMSCSDPNWQQVPKKGDGKQLRRLVRAQPGYKLVCADFSNIEARVLAELSGDERLLDIFDRDLDMHTEVAKLMFGLPAEWTKEQCDSTECPAAPGWSYRDVAKTINYGLFFGMSGGKLGRTIGQDRAAGDKLMAHYFRLLPGIQTYMDGQKKKALRDRAAYTRIGRYRALPLGPEPTRPKPNASKQAWADYKDALSEWRGQRARVERQGMNTPIQGTAADIAKRAVYLYDKREREDPIGAYLIMVVHDELLVSSPEAAAEEAKARLADAMMRAAQADLKRVKLPPIEPTISDFWEH